MKRRGLEFYYKQKLDPKEKKGAIARGPTRRRGGTILRHEYLVKPTKKDSLVASASGKKSLNYKLNIGGGGDRGNTRDEIKDGDDAVSATGRKTAERKKENGTQKELSILGVILPSEGERRDETPLKSPCGGKK